MPKFIHIRNPVTRTQGCIKSTFLFIVRVLIEPAIGGIPKITSIFMTNSRFNLYGNFCIKQAGRHQPNRAEIVVTVTMTNYLKRKEAISTGRNTHFCILLVSDADNKVVYKQRLG